MRRDRMKRYGWISVLVVAFVLNGSLRVSGQATKDVEKSTAASATNAQAQTQTEARPFQFGGGNLNQFITKLRDQFGKEVYDLIEIRAADADRIYVPKMKLRATVRDSVFLDPQK